MKYSPLRVEIRDAMVGRGIHERWAMRVAGTLENLLPKDARAHDVCSITWEQLASQRNIGVKGIETIRSVFPYANPAPHPVWTTRITARRGAA